MFDIGKFVHIPSREEKKLERLARAHRTAAELSEKFTGTVEETAELFNSEYNPATEWGEDPRQNEA